MPEYTVATLLTILAVILVEILWLRTGVFRTAKYWVSLLIMFSFQILVDGWLTKLSDPIVIYAPEPMLGVRFPWDIPVEDFGFGFAMLTLTILIWKRLNRNDTGKAAHLASAPTHANAETQKD